MNVGHVNLFEKTLEDARHLSPAEVKDDFVHKFSAGTHFEVTH